MSKYIVTAIAIVALIVGGVAFWQAANPPTVQQMGVTNLDMLHLDGAAESTATPMLLVQNDGTSNSLELRDTNGTPVFYVDVDGNATYTGFSSGGGAVDAPVRIAGATAIATATPALVVDSLGVSVLLDVRDAATPVFSINNGGTWSSTGAGTHSGGQTINNWGVVSAPTAIATATPAMVVNSLGVSNILEVRDAATPVFTVNNGGGVSGKVLEYASADSGLYVVKTSALTTTSVTSATHGFTTSVTAYGCSLGEAPKAGFTTCACSVSSTTVTCAAYVNETTAATATGVLNVWILGK
jgi:hypothetical protein